MESNQKVIWLFLVRKDIYMYRHRGGKPSILKSVLKILMIIKDTFIRLMVQENDMRLQSLCER